LRSIFADHGKTAQERMDEWAEVILDMQERLDELSDRISELEALRGKDT
jgi:hypothetical protein